MRIFSINLFLMFMTVLLISCSLSGPVTSEPEYLKLAGANQGEIQKALDHYRADSDTLKLKALEYLLKNMDGHAYIQVELYDSLDQVVPFCVTDYTNYNNMVAGWDSIEIRTGELRFEKSETLPDLETITADLLIENIEWSFKAWQELPWARTLNFDEFTNYILPYRGSNEPLESFRPLFWDRYSQQLLDADLGTDPVKAAALINQDLKTCFSFDPRYYRHPTDQGIAEMMEMKLGRCEDMTNLAIAAMRSNGIAVTSDYTPYWANTGNNHAWNAVLSSDKKIIPFMGCEADPGSYRLTNKLAKVYRKMYANQPGNLAFRLEDWEKVPRWVSGKSYLDVTADYVEVSDITLSLDAVPDSTRFAYLCVFNSGEWGAIHWGEIKENLVMFTDMGRDIVYLPTYYLQDELIPAAAPFILSEDGSIRSLSITNNEPEIQMTLTATTKRKLAVSTDSIAETFLTDGAEYELFVWQDDWQSLGTQTAGKAPLIFQVPEGGLYWLVERGSNQQERIFTWDNGQQSWW